MRERVCTCSLAPAEGSEAARHNQLQVREEKKVTEGKEEKEREERLLREKAAQETRQEAAAEAACQESSNLVASAATRKEDGTETAPVKDRKRHEKTLQAKKVVAAARLTGMTVPQKCIRVQFLITKQVRHATRYN